MYHVGEKLTTRKNIWIIINEIQILIIVIQFHLKLTSNFIEPMGRRNIVCSFRKW